MMKAYNKDVTIEKSAYSLKRWGYVLSGIIIMMCLGTVYSYSVFRLSIEELYNIGITESGLPYMTSLAFYSFFMFLTGKHIDKLAPRNIILFGGLIVSLGWILSAFAPNIYILTITYGFISGSGVGIVYGVPMSVVAKWFPEKKGLIVGLVLIGFGLSPLITAPIARFMVEKYGLMNAFIILGVSFGILISILSFTFKYPAFEASTPRFDSQTTNALNLKAVIKSRSFFGLYLNFMIGTMIGLMLIGLTSSIATELFGISTAKSLLLMSLFAIFNGAGRPIFGWITDKLSSRKAMLISYTLILSAATMLLFSKGESVLIYSIAFSIFWFNVGGWLAIAPTSTLSLFGATHYSQIYGVVFTAYGIGAISGVLTSGLLIDKFGSYSYIFIYVIGLCAIGMILTCTLIKRDNKSTR